MDNEEHELTLCEIKVEELSNTKDEMIKIDKDDILLLNDATEGDLEEYANDVVKNVEELMKDMGITDLIEDDYSYDVYDDYDYSYDDYLYDF